MDGVPHLTQHAVAPGETFDYRFTVPDAGTFWYHPHDRSWEQVARGLYGLLIVDEPDAPHGNIRDFAIVADDWRLGEDGQLDEASDRKSTRLNSSHSCAYRMPTSALKKQ